MPIETRGWGAGVGFADQRRLDEHFGKHGAEFGRITKQDYLRQAQLLRDAKVGGPVRFFIPDHAACHVAEVDECANVKFVDRIELTHGRGFDNRPTEEEEHVELHRRQAEGGE